MIPLGLSLLCDQFFSQFRLRPEELRSWLYLSAARGVIRDVAAVGISRELPPQLSPAVALSRSIVVRRAPAGTARRGSYLGHAESPEAPSRAVLFPLSSKYE